MKYTKKPITIEAIQFLDNADRICEIQEFMNGQTIRVYYEDKDNPFIPIETLEGTMKASVGDYIIKGVNGEFYPCKPEIFEKTYKCSETALDRIIIESEDLTNRLEKIEAFMRTSKFYELDAATRAMLVAQANIMQNYQLLLNLRYTKMESGNGSISGISLSVAQILLEKGFVIRRAGWNGKGLCVFKQVPAHINSEIIPKMQSLPQAAKEQILKHTGFINYESQCLIYNEGTGRADSWVPSISDIFAGDWEIVL